jgi:hypothetical protein
VYCPCVEGQPCSKCHPNTHTFDLILTLTLTLTLIYLKAVVASPKYAAKYEATTVEGRKDDSDDEFQSVDKRSLSDILKECK